MPWSSDFKTQLRSGQYHPKFRLIIGTFGVQAWSAGWWEQGAPDTPWVVEITSHGEPARDYDSAASYKHVRGLTTEISFGAQAVTPRSWEYQMASLSVGVTHEAASHALVIPPGCLAKLQCSMNGSDYNTIFMGQYMGMSWQSGKGSTTLNFRDALSYLQSRNTEMEGHESGPAHYTRPGYEYAWFKGIGDSYTTNDVCTIGVNPVSFGSSHYSTGTTPLDEFGFEFNYRRDEAFTIHADDRLGWVEGTNKFCYVKPTEGRDFLIRYNSTTSTSIAAFLNTTRDEALFGWERPNASPAAVFGTGSTVKPVLAIYGNPVCELANCFYYEGYNKHMIGPLFGNTSWSYDELDADNMTDVANVYRSVWQDETTGTAAAPMRAIISAQERDGYSKLRPLFAKMGVFPRFKNGAYSVGIGLDPHTMKEYPDLIAGTIRYSEIIALSWDQVDDTNRQIYANVNFVSKDDKSHSISAGGGSNPRTAPIIADLEVDNHDVAGGEAHAERFADWWMRQQYDPWYGLAPSGKVTVTLNNMRWAGAGLGELVSGIDYPGVDVTKAGWQHRLIGPSRYDSLSRTMRCVTTGSDVQPWVIIGTNTDWIRGTVTLTLANKQGFWQARWLPSKL